MKRYFDTRQLGQIDFATVTLWIIDRLMMPSFFAFRTAPTVSFPTHVESWLNVTNLTSSLCLPALPLPWSDGGEAAGKEEEEEDGGEQDDATEELGEDKEASEAEAASRLPRRYDCIVT